MHATQLLALVMLFITSVAVLSASAIAHAQQSFPSKPVRLIVASTAGGQPDMLSRMIGQKLSEAWGRPVVIDNRPGAGGVLGASTVAKSAPDGHTLLYAIPNFAISAVLLPGLPYEPLKAFTGVGQIGFSTNLLVAAPALGVKTVKDLVALAQSRPGKLIIASGATGTAGHLSGARFNVITGLKVVHVAFKGGPEAIIEVLTGRANYYVSTLGLALPFIQDGKLLPLAVTTPQRTPVLPEVPALAEMYSEFKQPETSHGLLAPAGTPRAILNQINKDIVRILDLPDIKERMQTIGFVAAPSTPEEYNKILRGQINTLTRLVSDAGLKPK
jgi:tripartite-type tricarboxylate transporter receptor subunit TctC